jgi:flagellar biosynthesis/type III secretory pathway ATPase
MSAAKLRYDRLKNRDFTEKIGKVKNVIGMIIEASGLPASIGEICTLHSASGTGRSWRNGRV